MNQRSVHKLAIEEQTDRLAVLIDADNDSADIVDGLLEEIAGLGEAIVKRIYGDFTSTQLAKWKKVLQKHAIIPMQQYANTTGKNSSDSALIIDAMDLLYSRKYDGFCLVSSDSDFTRLACRLREEGVIVYGFGKKTTPESLRNACYKFIYTELFRKPEASESAAEQSVKDVKGQNGAELKPDGSLEYPEHFIVNTLNSISDDTGWANLANLGDQLRKRQSDFDYRLYGFRKLNEMFSSREDLFEIDPRTIPGSKGKAFYVRLKKQSV